MSEIAFPVTFRDYQLVDYEPVAALWTRINRELAPSPLPTSSMFSEPGNAGELKNLALACLIPKSSSLMRQI